MFIGYLCKLCQCQWTDRQTDTLLYQSLVEVPPGKLPIYVATLGLVDSLAKPTSLSCFPSSSRPSPHWPLQQQSLQRGLDLLAAARRPPANRPPRPGVPQVGARAAEKPLCDPRERARWAACWPCSDLWPQAGPVSVPGGRRGQRVVEAHGRGVRSQHRGVWPGPQQLVRLQGAKLQELHV